MLKITTLYYLNLASNTIQFSLNQCLLGNTGCHFSLIKILKRCINTITKAKTTWNSQLQSMTYLLLKWFAGRNSPQHDKEIIVISDSIPLTQSAHYSTNSRRIGREAYLDPTRCKYKNIGNYLDKAEEQSRLKCRSYAMLHILCTQAAYVGV